MLSDILNNMSKDVAFSLDTKGGQDILTMMAMPEVKRRGQAILQRAQSMAQSMSKNPPQMAMTTEVGTIKKGVRAIAKISAEGKNKHQTYIAHYVLSRAKDAGRG